jgi:hypothetical protein
MIVQSLANASIVTRRVIELQNVKNLKDQDNAKTAASWDIKLMFVRNQQNQKCASIAEMKDTPQEIVLSHPSHVETARVRSIDTEIVQSQRNQSLATTALRLVISKANAHNQKTAEIVFSQVMNKRIVKMIMSIHLAWYVNQKNM